MTILNKESLHYFVTIWSKENLPKEKWRSGIYAGTDDNLSK